VVERLALGEIQPVGIAAGGHFAMHTSPNVAFCQVVRGAGKLADRLAFISTLMTAPPPAATSSSTRRRGPARPGGMLADGGD
jgi:hypothetical protein